MITTLSTFASSLLRLTAANRTRQSVGSERSQIDCFGSPLVFRVAIAIELQDARCPTCPAVAGDIERQVLSAVETAVRSASRKSTRPNCNRSGRSDCSASASRCWPSHRLRPIGRPRLTAESSGTNRSGCLRPSFRPSHWSCCPTSKLSANSTSPASSWRRSRDSIRQRRRRVVPEALVVTFLGSC